MLYQVHLAWAEFELTTLVVIGDPSAPGTPVSSTNKTDRHDTTAILLKVALNTIAIKFWYFDSYLLMTS
jgi:hypothetical protein